MSDNCCSPKSNREDAKNNNFINKSFSKNFNETKFENIDGGWFLMGLRKVMLSQEMVKGL